MKCGPENGFLPDLEKAERADVVYFCSPNNPTGAAATREQLEQLVAWAKERGSIIVFDAAYAPFIRSNIVQAGALAALEPEGLAEIEKLIDYYMGNAKMLLDTMLDLGFKVHGGIDAPYVFVDLEGKSSWDMFSELLETAQVVTIPGAGFGPGGEGFLRLSAFAP